MRASIKYSLAGLVGAGIFAGSLTYTLHKSHEYQTVKNEMLQQIQVAEDKKDDLGHKLDECVKMVHDCRPIYLQYKAAENELSLLKSKYVVLEQGNDSASWSGMIGGLGFLGAVFGLNRGLNFYLRERWERKRSTGEQ